MHPTYLRNIKSVMGVPFFQEVNNLPIIPISWMLLNNQPVLSVFSNNNLLTNIRIVDNCMNIHCNTGVTSTNQVGDLSGYIRVWYIPNDITYIISIAEAANFFRETHDSEISEWCMVHKTNGSVKNFRIPKRGVYYHDTDTANERGELIIDVDMLLLKL